MSKIFWSAALAVALMAAPLGAAAPEPDDDFAPDEAPDAVAPLPPRRGSIGAPPRSGNLPQIGFIVDGTIERHSRGDDPVRIRSAELVLGAPVDPYFDLFGVVLMTPDEVEIEEAYATVHFSSLLPEIPLVNRLQGRFGMMLLPFGHLGGLHPHDFPQTDPPLVMTEFLGGEAPHQTGGWVEYLAPFSVNPTLSLLVGAYAGDNGPPFDAVADRGAMWLMRATTFTEWGARNALRFSGSLLDDRNDTQSGLHSQLWSIEGKYRRTFALKGRQIVLGGEYLRHERRENALTLEPQNNGHDLVTTGVYLWGRYDHDMNWGVGYRYDATHQLFARERTTVHSPYLEYRPTEFSRLRLQYSAVNPPSGPGENRILLQGTWMIGWHPAHRF